MQRSAFRVHVDYVLGAVEMYIIWGRKVQLIEISISFTGGVLIMNMMHIFEKWMN